MQEKSQATTVSEARAPGSIFPLLLEYKGVCILFTTVVYVICFILLYPILGMLTPMFSVVPVLVVGWGYGLRGGLIAGLLNILLNTFLLNLTGNEPAGWDALVSREGGVIGSLFVVLVGVTIGKLSDVTQQLQQEIHSHQQTEEKLERSQERLELRVAERTEELSKQQELLYEAQSLARFGTIKEDLQTGERWWSDEVYHILGITPQNRYT